MEGLERLHKIRWAHGDIKPENFVTLADWQRVRHTPASGRLGSITRLASKLPCVP